MEKLKKVFSPGHQKDEDVLYGDNNTNTPTTTTGHTGAEGSHFGGQHSDTTTSRPAGVTNNASTASIKSGMVGSPGQHPTSALGSATGPSTTQQTLPDRTAERSFPLSSGKNTTNTSSTLGTNASSNTQALDSDMDPTSFHEHKGRGHQFAGDPCPPGDEPQMPGYVHHVPGPHGTDMANRLDPHIPGEFPADNGFDRHSRGTAPTTTAATAAPIGTTSAVPTSTATSAVPASTTTTTADPVNTTSASSRDMTSGPPREHHLGRDAALVGGAGAAAGLGAHEIGSRKHEHDLLQGPGRYDDQSFDPSAAHTEKARHIPDLMYGSSTTHGRDAPRGSEAAGVGASTAGHRAGSTDTDPASKTVGPHKSNIANIVDPRVLPEPSKMKGAVNDGPYSRDYPEQHHYGRDAAMVGGAGTVGAGAYEATTRGKDAPRGVGASGLPTGDPEGVDAYTARGKDAPPGVGASGMPTGPTSTNDGQHSRDYPEQYHYGRDPAMVGGAGALGTGAHDATTRGKNAPTGVGASGLPIGPTAADSSQQHHHGRDAALAGGVGAAGVGAYEYGKHDTGAHASSITAPTGSKAPIMGSAAAPIGSGVGPYQTGAYADPAVQDKQHHYGRDAALAGGAGAAGAGAYEASKGRAGPTATDPATSTVGPHSSNLANIVDPRVQPEPEKMKDRNTIGPHKSDALNTADPQVDSDPAHQQHHYGRDAALAGGAGAAGIGAYEYGQHNTGASQQLPTSSIASPIGYSSAPNNSTAFNGPAAAPLGSTAATSGSTAAPHQSSTLNRADPRVESSPQGQQHHYGRDAALAGGAGAAGVGAYEYGKHDTRAPTSSTAAPVDSTTTAPTGSTTTPHQSGTYNDPAAQDKQHHYGRDAAVAGGAGAVAAGAYEAIDPKQEEKLQQERLKEAEKAHKAQQKEHDKELKHERKEHDKEVKHEKKEHDKEVKHAQKEAQKEHEKEEKKAAAAAAASREKVEKQRRHDLEKAEKERQKEAEKHEKELEKENEKGEKKHGFLGLFKGKDKTKGTEEEELAREQGHGQEADRLAHERHQRELEGGAATGDLHAAGAKYEPSLEQQHERPLESAPQHTSIDDHGHQHVSTDPKGRHRLHKEPPASVLKERGLDSTE